VVRVVGLGSQQDQAAAQAFARDTGITSVTMLWDPTGSTWKHYGIVQNSETWLLDAKGNRIGRKMFGLDAKARVIAEANARAGIVG